jgi:hypothetical protein
VADPGRPTWGHHRRLLGREARSAPIDTAVAGAFGVSDLTGNDDTPDIVMCNPL